MENLERSFIDKNEILKYVSEKNIFKLVFGFIPVEYEKVVSPFRKDNNPGCWFYTDFSTNRLKFVDFGNTDIINGIKMNNIDCFSAVQIYYNLDNFYETLKFIREVLIDNKNLKIRTIPTIKPVVKKDVKIYINKRNFNLKDKHFWSKYGISIQSLINDKVFPVKKFKLLNTRFGDITKTVYDQCYSFNNFDNNRKKLYRPFQKKNKKFITNCKSDDIGEINSLIEYGEQLIISKSYKDCRVLRNENLNSIWFQNEGMFPSNKKLISLCKRFTKIIIFFDNDEAGIKASERLKSIINNFFPGKADNLYLSENLLKENISDPSDLFLKKGKIYLTKFITKNKLK